MRQRDSGNLFVCPFCKGPTYVVSSAPTSYETLPAARRRRECKSCKSRFTTFEVLGLTGFKLRTLLRELEGLCKPSSPGTIVQNPQPKETSNGR